MDESTTENIRFCPQCGKGLTQLTKFCPYCGHSLEDFTNQPKSGPALQLSVDEDALTAFIGNNAGYYTREFKKFNIAGMDAFSLTWNWPAFLGGFGWLLYRKMYAWSIVAFVLMFIPYLGLASWMALGAVANYLYYQHAKRKILEVRTMDRTEEISVVLSQIGGVHRWLPIAAIILTILLFLLFMAFLFWMPFGILNLFKMPATYI